MAELLQDVTPEIDVVLLETHEPEPYPTILSDELRAVDEEVVIGSWNLPTIDFAVERLIPAVRSLVPRDHGLDKTLRTALAFHGGHACPGMVLGARLAMTAGRSLELSLPDRHKRLFVMSETDRCAADAIQTITGCRPGKRTLKFLDYGKLAARFLDVETGRAIRVATRSGLREIAQQRFPDPDRHASQMRAYLDLPAEELFSISPTDWSLGLYEQPGPPIRRVECSDCGEEVSDGREVPCLVRLCGGEDISPGEHPQFNLDVFILASKSQWRFARFRPARGTLQRNFRGRVGILRERRFAAGSFATGGRGRCARTAARDGPSGKHCEGGDHAWRREFGGHRMRLPVRDRTGMRREPEALMSDSEERKGKVKAGAKGA